MPEDTMTPRERWLAVLNRQSPDRVPTDYWATAETTVRLIRYLGLSQKSEAELLNDFGRSNADDPVIALPPTDVRRLAFEALQELHVDFVLRVGPRYAGPSLEAQTDPFGCRYQDVDYGAGVYAECIYHPLAQYQSVQEIENSYTWPDADWWDYSHLPQQVKGMDAFPIQGGGSEPFLTYKSLRGQEQAFMDLVLNPEIVHYCLDKLFDLAYANTRRIYAQIPGQVTLSYVAEDMGGQDDLMISPAQIREFLIPRMKRMIDLAHEAGVFVFHHNDGACRRIIPDMVAAGIDVLNPIQWRSKGMEREALKRDFGDRLVFHGAVDNQYTLPFGSVEEVHGEVLDNLRILGAGGGYILAPCHNLQSITPPANIVAMYQTCYEHGWTSNR